MIKRFKLILIAALASLAAVCLMAGCNLTTDLDDVLEMYNLECRVTYILNEGEFDDKEQVKNIYYPANTKPYEVSTNTVASTGGSGSAKVELRTGYSFLGWYEVVTNSDGLPLYTDGSVFDVLAGLESGKTIDVTDTKYDFTRALQKDEEVYVCAKWLKLSTLQLHLVCDGFDKLEIKDSDGNVTATYVNDDVIYEYPLVSDINSSSPADVFKTPGYTFVAFYTSLDATERFTDWPVRVPEEITDIPIYARYIEGTWNIVENTSGVMRMFQRGAENYYFLNDVDCSTLDAVNNMTTLSGEIRGNGCTVSNLKIAATAFNGNITGLFGDIRDTAKVSDLTIENVQAEYVVSRNADAEVYFMCATLSEKATFTNFSVSGSVSVLLQSGAQMSDIESDNWIYGGYTNDNIGNIAIDISGGLTYEILQITSQNYDDNNNLIYITSPIDEYVYPINSEN